MRLRQRTFEVLEVARENDPLSSLCDALLVTLISLNVLFAILESLPSLGVPLGSFFRAFDLASVAIFTIEYVLRMWSVVESHEPRYRHPLKGRLRYAVSPMALVDLVAVAPFYLASIVGMDLRFLRVLRILRILKLSHYFSALNVMLDVIRVERHAFGAAFFLLVLGVLFASSGIYLFEHEAQPEVFGSIPAAMWWAIVTLTTVGYGDVTPITPVGRIFGASISILGIGTVALPTGILASGFAEALRRHQRIYGRRRREALADGLIDPQEAADLARLQHDLGLMDEEVEGLGEERRGTNRNDKCPHCGECLLEG